MQLRFSFCNADSSKQRQQQQKQQQLKGKGSRRCQPTWRGTRVAISLCLCRCLCVPQRTGSLAAFGSALAKNVYKIIAYGKVATFETFVQKATMARI